MSSTSETGHARNLAAFEQLIAFCTSFQARYNPSRHALTISSLQSKLQEARSALQQVKVTEAAYSNATRQRAEAYRPIRPLATRVINALAAADVSRTAVPNARSIVNKIQGRSKKKEETPLPPAGEDAAVQTPRTISRSQASYDNLADHFEKLIELLGTEPGYMPNESDLAIGALQQYMQQLHSANTQVIATYTACSNARVQRDQVFYAPLGGLVAVGMDVKKYIKSIFGAASAEYRQVSGLEIKTQPAKS